MVPQGEAVAEAGQKVFRRGPLGWLILLFLATRLLYLTLIHPDYLLTFPSEELFRGTIAQELMSGPSLPFIDYRADNFSGGSLVIGALASFFFGLFGPTAFALKLAPLLIFTLALVFWFLTLQRHVSERVALYFAIIFCFSPPLFTAYSMAAMGFHTESIFFTALSLFLFFEVLSGRTPARIATILLGLTAGFGLWFTYGYGLTLVAVLLFWLWQDEPTRLKTGLGYFGLGFAIGFLPWIIINTQNHFSGLVIHGAKVWGHFGPEYLLKGISDRRWFVPYQFFGTFASEDPTDLPRRALNIAYMILFLAPILAAGIVVPKAWRSGVATPMADRPKLTVFGILYLCVFMLAVQLSDFRESRYNQPAYPFLFFLLAYSIARLEETFRFARNKVRAAFLSSVILLATVGHSALFSLDTAGSAFSAKGYAYGSLPETFLCRVEVLPCLERVVPQLEETVLLSSLLPKLSPEDRREFSVELVGLLAAAAPLYQQSGEFSRVERLVPRGFDKHFYYSFGITAMSRHGNELSKAVASVDFLKDRSAAWHHLALFGIYRLWPQVAALDVKPASLTSALATMPPETKPFYWRALGYYAGRYSYDANRSLEQLHAHLQAIVPRLDPSVQRYFLQGIGQFLFSQWTSVPIFTLLFAPSEMERFDPAYHQGLFEGAGMELSEFQLFSWVYWTTDKKTRWNTYTRGLSETSISYIREGGKQFSAIFEGSV